MRLDDRISIRTKSETDERAERLHDKYEIRKSEILRRCLRIGVESGEERGIGKMARHIGLETAELDDDMSFRVPSELSKRVESLADELSDDPPTNYHPDVHTKSAVARLCLQAGLTSAEDDGVEVLFQAREN